MPRFQPLASDSLHPRLAATCVAALLCLGSAHAAKPVVTEELDAIDTTFGEEQPMPPPVRSSADAAADLADSATSAAPSVAEAMEPTEPMEDGAFENVFAPGESYERNWSLDFQTSLGGTDPDTTAGTVWIGLSRSFEDETKSFVPRMGWTRVSRSPDDRVSNAGLIGASVFHALVMDLAFGLDAQWKFQDGPDEWYANANLSWEREFSDLFGASAEALDGWSSTSRRSSGAAVGVSFHPGSWVASVDAIWNRRWQEYRIGRYQHRNQYVHVWGWSTALHWTSGSWTTGPRWSGEYFQTSARQGDGMGDTHYMQITSKVSSSRTGSVSGDGAELDQTVSWMLAWKPIESLRLVVDLSRSFGLSDIPTRSTKATARKIFAERTIDAFLPSDSYGGTMGFSFDW